MKRTVLFLAVMVLVLAATPMFAAGSQQGNIAVSASVADRCTITTNPLGFGPYDTFTGAAVNGQADIVVQCTKGSGTSLNLNAGQNAAAVGGSDRAMKNGTSFLGYDLFEDSARTTKWTGNFSTWVVPSSKAPITLTVYGTVAASQDVPAGTYNDTVQATINW